MNKTYEYALIILESNFFRKLQLFAVIYNGINLTFFFHLLSKILNSTSTNETVE